MASVPTSQQTREEIVQTPVTGQAQRLARTTRSVAPGLGLCAAAVIIALVINHVVPPFSALLVAIVLGVLVRNLLPLHPALEPGITFAAKRLLRLGVVLLGLQLSVTEIARLGAGMIVVVVAVVTGGIVVSLLVGRMLGMSLSQRLLIGSGFSICGAAAVAAIDGVTDAEEEDVVTGVALVVIFGTLMIPIMPLAASGLGLGELASGEWIGSSVHEVAQVVAASGAVGAGALGVAVVVKLARVLMLAPVMAVISWHRRRQTAAAAASPEGQTPVTGKQPPIVPLFVVGFIAMVALRSVDIVPSAVLSGVSVVQTGLLAAAMFGLGCGVRLSLIKRVGARPFILAAIVTVFVATLALAGVALFG